MSGPAQACHNSEFIFLLSPSSGFGETPFDEGAFMIFTENPITI